MAATITTLSNVLKDHYQGPIQEQLNNATVLLANIESSKDDLVGNQAVVPLHAGRTGGIGARAEGGTLPTHGNQVFTRAVYDLKYLYGRIRFTGPSMAKTKNDVGAFTRVVTAEVEGLKTDLKKDLARQVYGAGNSVLATVGTGSTVTNVVLTSAEPINKGQIYVGLIFDMGTLVNPQSRTTTPNGYSVIAVAPATLSFTVSGAGTATAGANGEFVFRAGSAAASSVSYEIAGLQQIVPTAANTFGGINAATSAYWDNQRDTTGGAVTLDQIQQMLNKTRIQGASTEMLVTTFGIQRQVFNQLQSQVRYTDAQTIKGGWKTLEYAGYPIVADLDCPNGFMWVLDTTYIKNFTNEDWRWLEEDGNMLKWVIDQDAWEGVLARYMNLGITRRAVQGVISGLTDTGF
jgi:hypothetical protein